MNAMQGKARLKGRSGAGVVPSRVFRVVCPQRDSNQFVFSVLVNDTTENKFKYASFNQY